MTTLIEHKAHGVTEAWLGLYPHERDALQKLHPVLANRIDGLSAEVYALDRAEKPKPPHRRFNWALWALVALFIAFLYSLGGLRTLLWTAAIYGGMALVIFLVWKAITHGDES